MSNYREKERVKALMEAESTELNLLLSEKSEELLTHLAGELREEHLGEWFPGAMEQGNAEETTTNLMSFIEGKELEVLRKLARDHPQYYSERYADIIAEKAYDSLAQGALKRELLEGLISPPQY